MKNGFKLMLLIYLFSHNIYAQYGTINSVYLFPSNPTDADTIYAVADLSFFYDNCILNNSYTIQNGNNLHLHTNYCIGNVQTNCSKIDTFNLGIFAAGTYTANFSLAVRPNNCLFPGVTINTVSIDTLTIGLFTSINANEANRDYSLFPNPTHNSEVNVLTADPKPFSISCFNNIGMLVFEMNNLTGNQKINLPEVKGIYFIKITDNKSLNNTFKCVNY
jgi:hypothetical protein